MLLNKQDSISVRITTLSNATQLEISPPEHVLSAAYQTRTVKTVRVSMEKIHTHRLFLECIIHSPPLPTITIQVLYFALFDEKVMKRHTTVENKIGSLLFK